MKWIYEKGKKKDFVIMFALIEIALLSGTVASTQSNLFDGNNSAAYAQSPQALTTNSTTVAQETTLLVGDIIDRAIKRLDIETGNVQVFVPTTNTTNNYNIVAPRGIIVTNDTIFLSNQKSLIDYNNATLQPINGDILRFDKTTGEFKGTLVNSTNKDAPFVPRGIVLSPDGRYLFVADAMSSDRSHGFIRQYDAINGTLVGKWFDANSTHFGQGDGFFPRGLVFSPDGKLLYVSVIEEPRRNPNAGYILSFDPTSSNPNNTFKVIVASNRENNYASELHRPEGIVFSPDGKTIWAASFRAVNSTNYAPLDQKDQIIAYDAVNGTKVNSILLHGNDGRNRVFAQDIAFGPEGKLFVPIRNTGQLRIYTILQNGGHYTMLPLSGNPLIVPYYLTFLQTNSSTLAFGK